MLNPYACPHPLNRLRQNKDQPLLICQDCLSVFDMGLALGWDRRGESTAQGGRMFKLMTAMRDDSHETTPLKNFVPHGVTLDEMRPRDVFAEAEASGPERNWRPPGRA